MFSKSDLVCIHLYNQDSKWVHHTHVVFPCFMGTFPMRNDFYTMQTVFISQQPYTSQETFFFRFSKTTSFCMIYTFVSSWGPQKCPSTFGPHNMINTRYTHTLNLPCESLHNTQQPISRQKLLTTPEFRANHSRELSWKHKCDKNRETYVFGYTWGVVHSH